eukprot:2521798-Ditylum_brightwellii.AAC.1
MYRRARLDDCTQWGPRQLRERAPAACRARGGGWTDSSLARTRRVAQRAWCATKPAREREGRGDPYRHR